MASSCASPLMLSVHLEGHAEPMAIADDMDAALERARQALGVDALLWHQAATYQALDDAAIACNVSATGTGKTLAAQLHLLRGNCERVMVVAPTNALIDQHVDSWRRFIKKLALPHRVIGLDAARLKQIRVHHQGPDANNARRLFELMTAPQQVLADHPPHTPLVIVTNPDIFYLATFMQYRRSAQQGAEAVINHVDYLVVDEFHYYSGVQLVAFFFVMGLWTLGERFAQGLTKACLLTATPDEEVLLIFDSLLAQGLQMTTIDPASAPIDRPRRPSLAPCELSLRIAHHDTLEDKLTDLLLAWAPELEHGDDAAVLLDSLSLVSRLTQRLRRSFGTQLRRITGPTPREQRADAQRAPLILATPTVDIGYNFEGRAGTERPLLERVVFEAPSRPRFWQRLGRAGRVLPLGTSDGIHAKAVAFIPEDIFVAFRQAQLPPSMTRAALARVMVDLGECYRETRVAPLLEDWAAIAIAQPLTRIYDTCDPADQPLVAHYFNTLSQLFGPTPRTFDQLRAAHQAFEEAKRISRGDIPHKPYLGWYRVAKRNTSNDRIILTSLSAPERKSIQRTLARRDRQGQQARAMIQNFAKEEVARTQAWLQFRGSGRTGTNVLAWDPIGLYADTPAWVSLSLEECIRNTDFSIFDADALAQGITRGHWPTPPNAWGKPLCIHLDAALRTRRSLHLAYDFPTHAHSNQAQSSRDMQGYVGVETKFRLEACFQRPGYPPAPLPTAITQALLSEATVFFIPWRMTDIRRLPQAQGLTETRFVFRQAGREVAKLSGYLHQHAVLAHALWRQQTRRSARTRGTTS